MEPWPFIIAAYACTIVGTTALILWSFARMRASESRVSSLREDTSS